MQQPIENCYWVEPGRLLAGEYPCVAHDMTALVRLNALVHAGVRSFINLTETHEGLFPYASLFGQCDEAGDLTHERFGIRDAGVPRSHKHVATILNAIDRRLASGRVVYVHCRGGIGRTGVIVGCWLARHGHPGDQALARLRELWRACPRSADVTVPETEDQARYIVEWTEEA